ncbi:MAG: hypothetical protein DMF06_02855 [Verrucomicrobia bacterium]|nr:MAG: hypothetical protein DMF06_02855 [Verrucomicrobiota bacterium]
MKIDPTAQSEKGSVLITCIVTITILTMICATSLYITSQNANSGMQTASWQLALAGAESAVDSAYNALNTNQWTGWQKVSGITSLPTAEPTAGSTATSVPSPAPNFEYNYYLPPALSLQGEGASTVSSWVTVDTANLPKDKNGNQWYRIRATGIAAAAGPRRVSNQKLDNDLRKLSLFADRNAPGTSVTPRATRTIEVIASAVAKSIWVRGITLRDWINMSGGGVIDSFDSSNPFKSSTINGVAGQYDILKRQSNGDVGTANSLNSDLRSTYVYGDLQYSGPAVKNTLNVQGTISTPFNPTIPTVSAPNWASGTYTSLGSGNPVILTSGTKTNPARYKINGDMTVSGGNVLTINNLNGTSGDNYIEIWVTGKYTISGSGYVDQNTLVHSDWYVGSNITTSGDSYNNRSGIASNVNFVGYGTNNTLTVSGSATFVGTINAPAYRVTVSGSGGISGALIGDTLTISGGAGLHYDEALNINGNSNILGNYSYASWFEDNSLPVRGITY